MIPKQLVEHVLEKYHDHVLGCHRSRDRFYETLRNGFFWPMTLKDIKEYVNSCELSLKIKTRAPIHNGLLRPIETKRPFELIGIDIAYLPVSKGGFRYILVAIDYFMYILCTLICKFIYVKNIKKRRN